MFCPVLELECSFLCRLIDWFKHPNCEHQSQTSSGVPKESYQQSSRTSRTEAAGFHFDYLELTAEFLLYYNCYCYYCYHYYFIIFRFSAAPSGFLL